MQVVDKKNVEKRITFYISKMYSQTISKGEDYSKLQKCIAILITNYTVNSLKYMKKYVTKWNIREEDYVNHILTDDIEIYIIELPKVEKYKKGLALDHWVEFIRNPKVINMSNNEIRKAKKVLEEISQDERERSLAELREKHIRDQIAIEAAGFDKGLEQGIEQGITQGIEQGKIQVAKQMKSKGFDLNTISELTGLTVKEIEKL